MTLDTPPSLANRSPPELDRDNVHLHTGLTSSQVLSIEDINMSQ